MITGLTTPKQIIWAIDAFQERGVLERRTMQAIRALVHDLDAEVQPVYVMAPDRLNVPSEILYPQIESFLQSADQALKNILKRYPMPDVNLKPPHIVTKVVYSTTGAVRALDEYGVETNTSLIVVGTHGRSGMPRLFMGSFAETLLLHSSIPVLLVGAGSGEVRRFKHILFPTDFGEGSNAIFDRVLELAKAISAKLTIFHTIPAPIVVVPTPEIIPVQRSYIDVESQKSSQQVEALVDLAQRSGIHAETMITVSQAPLGQAILKAAKDVDAQLIAMAAQSGAISSAITGSATRQVVRTSFCPVWVLHKKFATEHKSADRDKDSAAA